ncbi:hypothetical protein J3Q64DRAFT_1007750 [Phycomyces blakesleeanus]|uniref:Uncharacterized protein n=2 Tax=Phycomyces blakesleeanus TaxID=4837 RepID=A0A167PFU9_PHYB8|nr:hypothetical protein PHYBLDRAFT_76519 [Phycomyces blakesleeanus NRRL 1555(-)]OAD77829.1 hypothetical protein PHYBLDRAFT_76519 [Phycomyces blakesleeanus NRRL 1555(-)]|eukprot:XP_018295869.1 hypothetical protein PHYBLDRAFT_76519 [Phycomyces blakesleeanus NRRL 1555(-)]
MSDGDSSYLAMLNNPVINPPANSEPAATQETTTVNAPLATFEAATKAQKELKDASKNLELISETEAEFQSVNVAWGKNTELPTPEQLAQLGLISDPAAPCKTKTLDQFFSTRTSEESDSYGQAARFRQLEAKLVEVFGGKDKARVYQIGEYTITVLILGVINGENGNNALVGLRSLLVQT